MFLATTALTEFWDKDQEILFLGPWCIRYDKRSEWESLNYQVLPSPWDDRERFHRVTEYLNDSYERILDQMANYLNTVHRVSFEKRYWRILIGPWLFHYMHAYYDRYIHLQEAFQKCPDLETIALDQRCFKTPRDSLQGMDFLTSQPCDDIYNLQIYSQLLQSMGRSGPVRKLRNGWPETADPGSNRAIAWRPAARAVRHWGFRLAGKTISLLLGKRCQIGLFDMYASRSATWALAWKTGFRAIPIDLPDHWVVPEAVFDGSRNGLANLETIDEFERFLVEWLPQNFPAQYLEGFENSRVEIALMCPRIPSVVVSSIGWYYNERFQFLAAEASQQGSRIVAVQHGGGYGIVRYSAPELHEASVADSYMVWGWADDTQGPYRNLPGLKIPKQPSDRSRKRKSKKVEPFLFVSTSHPRYLHRFHSQPVVGQWEDYIEWGLRFMTAVSKRTRSTIIFRPYPIDYGWAHQERISDKFPDIQLDGDQPFHKLLGRCSVAVIDNPSTTFLEAMAANVPTVLFWDPELWGIRDEARPHFEDLSRTGVLWQLPEEAAAHVEQILDDPWAWWGSTEVQEVRLQFVERYALARKDWADCWARALEEEVALSHADV